MQKYIQRDPRIVKAVQWTGGNFDEVADFIGPEYKCLPPVEEFGSLLLLNEENILKSVPLNAYVYRRCFDNKTFFGALEIMTDLHFEDQYKVFEEGI